MRFNRLLYQALAASAGPLAIDVAVHEELRRHDIQLLADVLTHAYHGPSTARCWAVSILGFVVMLDSAQVGWQWLATGLALGLGVVFNRGLALGLLQLRLQTGLVFGQGSPQTGGAARRSSPRSWLRTSMP
ncbi:protein of unknown function (plasmid) [Cupriavidus taiwanensis]|uniref:Uncharacterized protein n=1 Tax=Cupriavidus taiwanensis TaxID=164546 RepID=A0A375ECH9_9BURK|nr:protein of unknown function [Cupriavidus taiwanensis]SOZ72330.1 protein of unknown function [Cupriavidus taiwanensis]SOZ74622.1 protein of unknown function [Cupriavidus taiwanensis]